MNDEIKVLRRLLPYFVAGKRKIGRKEVKRVVNEKKYKIPLWKKYSLSVYEAAEYFGIGERKLRQIAEDNARAEFLLEIGSHIRFKRELFSRYLDEVSVI